MRTKKIEFEVCDEDDASIIPFDQEDQRGMKYHLHVNSEKDTDKDRVILSLNKASCQAFAQLFGQLAHGPYHEGFHAHLGYEAKEAYGRGIRICLL